MTKIVVFAGGGTGGHIYPGIAVADELKKIAAQQNVNLKIYWIGNSSGMDRDIVESNLSEKGGSIDGFYGILSGKLRRYFSIKNCTDLIKIALGIVQSYVILKKLKPDFLFSKGGFVSVTPCLAASILKIPYFTHECDFTPGLATKINSRKASGILVSYEKTKDYFNKSFRERITVTGNPVRPVFYEDHAQEGLDFLGIKEKNKPVLLVLGGSLGARQINELVIQNLDELKKDFIVVHQTGRHFAVENPDVMNSGDKNYKPYDFIYSQMPYVVQCADVVLSRSGANSLWECAVCAKPMILVPLCGSGTRGDQVDNARNFESQGAAIVLAGQDAVPEKLLEAVNLMKTEENRKKYSEACKKAAGSLKSASEIAKIVFSRVMG